MMLVALQVGLQPLVTKKCVDDIVSTRSLVLVENAVTAVMSLSTLYLTVPEAFADWRLSDSIALAGPPAMVYAIRSLCKQGAYRSCDGVTFNIINQTKTVFCAIAAWFLLGEAQSLQQCAALLCAICAGVVLILPQRQAKTHGSAEAASKNVVESTPKVSAPTASDKDNGAAKPTETLALSKSAGITLAIATAICSGLAAALSQMAFRSSRGDGRPSTLFTFELALWGAPFAIILGGRSDAGSAKDGGSPSFFSLVRVMRGWRLRTLAPICLQAAGGILVGAVVKQHGGVAMGLCTIIGIAVSVVADATMTRRPPSMRQTFAALLAASSIVVHQAHG